MCLAKITKKYRKNDELVVAYKAFKKDFGNKIIGTFYGGPYILGEVYKATDYRIQTYTSKGSYASGFHCFKELENARNYVLGNPDLFLYEIHIWDIRAEGTDQGHVFVAKNMRIVRRLNKKGDNYGG